LLVIQSSKKCYDLYSFNEVVPFKDFITPVIQNNNFYSTNDYINFLGNEYKKELNSILTFQKSVFFHIYSHKTDMYIFQILFEKYGKTEAYMNAYAASEVIESELRQNKAFMSFLKYNLTFRKHVQHEKLDWKENYSTFRVSNKFIAKSNSEIVKECSGDGFLIEIDMRGADILFLSFVNFLHRKNYDLMKLIVKNGIYNSVDMFDDYNYKEKKNKIIVGLYATRHKTEIQEKTKKLIKSLDLEDFFDYIINNDSFYLPNGVKRTNEHGCAIYCQTLTSIFFMRIIVNSLIKYLRENKLGTVVCSKHDSIIIKTNTIDFNLDSLYIDTRGKWFNYLGKDIQVSEQDEKIFNVLFKNNVKIAKLND